MLEEAQTGTILNVGLSTMVDPNFRTGGRDVKVALSVIGGSDEKGCP